MEFVHPIYDIKKIEDMKKVLKGTNIRDYCLFTVGINSGLRIRDLLTLHIGAVVDEKIRPLDKIKIVEKKTGKAKEFPFGATTKKALIEYLSTRKNIKLRFILFSKLSLKSYSKRQLAPPSCDMRSSIIS